MGEKGESPHPLTDVKNESLIINQIDDPTNQVDKDKNESLPN